MGRAYAALVAVTLLWGASFTVIKGALDEVAPFLLIALRFALAAGILLVLRPRSLRALRPGPLLETLPLGLLIFAAYGLQTLGLVYTTPSRSAFLTASSVLLVPVLGRILFGERGARTGWIGALLAGLGIALITRPGGSTPVGLGEALTGLSALAYALHILLLGRRARQGGSVRELGFLQMGWVVVFALPASLAFEGRPPRLGLEAWGAVVFLGVFCSALAIAAQTWAQKQVPAAGAALVFALEPVFAAAIAAVFVGERMGAWEIVGGALVVAGVVVARPPNPPEALELQAEADESPLGEGN